MNKRGNSSNLIDFTAEAPGMEPLNPSGGPLSPEPRPKYHDDFCNCESCLDIRAAVENYLKAKRLYNESGF